MYKDVYIEYKIYINKGAAYSFSFSLIFQNLVSVNNGSKLMNY